MDREGNGREGARATPWRLVGHAIVSADDRITGADGRMPAALIHEADQARYQAALDEAVLTVLGRVSHEVYPNRKGRRRLVLSSSARGVERRDDAWWWNPAEASPGDALAAAAPEGGLVVVAGGRRVYDLFLQVGFGRFELARAERVQLPSGTPIFSACASGATARALLAQSGLVARSRRWLDEGAPVSLEIWTPAGGPDALLEDAELPEDQP